MAFFRGDMHSKVMELESSVSVILPQDRVAPGQHLRTLYLLHGYGENASNWMRFSSVERYAVQYGFAVVMPEVQHSYYTDMQYGMPYGTFISEELPALCEKMFQLPADRNDTFIAGLSMGGYGALKLGLGHPERFRGCASFSGVADLRGRMPRYRTLEGANEFAAIFGKDFAVPDDGDTFLLADRVAALPEAERVAVYMACGLQDGLLDCNHQLRDHVQTLPLTFQYEEWDGRHDFGFWDVSLQHAMAFFAQLP
ncbi:MAG: alpha/beta hydrolase family protein [Clostridia bacterium]